MGQLKSLPGLPSVHCKALILNSVINGKVNPEYKQAISSIDSTFPVALLVLDVFYSQGRLRLLFFFFFQVPPWSRKQHMLADNYDTPPGGESNLESSEAAVSPTMRRLVTALAT